MNAKCRLRAKKGLALGLLLAVAQAGGGCGRKASSEVDAIQASGNFRVAIVDTNSPYTSTEGNTPVGIEPELAEYIAQNLGVQVKYQVCGRKEALAAVADGEADVAMGCISNSGSLAGDYLVTTGYGKGYFYAVTRTGDYALTIGAFENSSLGADGELDEETKNKFYQAEGIRITDYGSAQDGAKAVKDGTIRAYICYEGQAERFLEDEELQVQNVANLEPEEFVIVTGKSNAALTDGMNTLIRQFLEGAR